MACRAQIVVLAGLLALGCGEGPLPGEGAGVEGAGVEGGAADAASGGEGAADAALDAEAAEAAVQGVAGLAGGFDAKYVGCDEFAGVGLVPRANVVGRVPAGYTVLEPVPGSALVVAQGGRCESITVAGHSRKGGIFAQFGVGIVPPTGAGDGNFYQLMFATNHPGLAVRMALLGANASFAPGIDYDVGPSSAPGLRVSVPWPSSFAWGHEGPITLPDHAAPPNPVTTFNYWHQSPFFGNVRQQNVVTGIRLGEGAGVVMNAIGPEMREIVGAPSMTFAFFSKPEVFDHANLSVRAHVF
jgi:hypothetical protein